MKNCTKCHSSKPILDFYKQSVNSKDGYQSHCKQCDNARKQDWKIKNPAQAKQHAKVADSNKYIKNKQAINLNNKQWKIDNPAKVLAMDAKRRAAKLHRTPKWLESTDIWMIEEMYDLAVLRTKSTGFTWHVDHIISLQGRKVSGLHVPANLRVVPGSENLAKSNKFNI